MYEGRWEDIAGKWGKVVGQAAIQGMGDGITEKREYLLNSAGQMAAAQVEAQGGDKLAQQQAFHAAVDTILNGQPKPAGVDLDAPVTHTTNKGADKDGDGTGGTTKPKEEPATVVAKQDDAPVVHNEEPAPVVVKKDDAPVVHNEEPAPVVVKKDDAPVVHNEEPAPVVVKKDDAPVVHVDEPVVAKKEPSHDQAQRDALVELAIKDAKTPEDHKMIAEWAKEIDTKNPKPMNEALADLHQEAKADGVVTPSEASALKAWDTEAVKTNYDAIKADNTEAGAVKKAKETLEKTDSVAAALIKPKEANADLSADIQGTLDRGVKARTGEDPQLQNQRADFERAIALSPEAQAAIKPMLDSATQKALDYLQKMYPDGNGGIKPEVLSSLGVDPSKKNYAGAIGTDPDVILAALQNGNPRERMVALSEFQEKVLGPDALNPAQVAKMKEIFGTDSNTGAFSQADFDRLTARAETYLDKLTLGKDPSGKEVFNPHGDDHKGYWDAKGQDMDTKLPSFTKEALSEQMGVEIKKPSSGIGEANPIAKTDMTIEEANKLGFQLSDAEIQQAKGANPQGTELPWVKGSVANMVDPDAPFVQGANENSMPLKAGISGTTARAMGLFDTLGMDPELARLACMVQLQQIEAHSYHEIASASNGYMKGDAGEFKYDVNNPYANMGGLTPTQLQEIAARQGMNFDDLNGQKTTPKASSGGDGPNGPNGPNRPPLPHDTDPATKPVEPVIHNTTETTTKPVEPVVAKELPRNLEHALEAKKNGETFTNKEIRDDYNTVNQGIPALNEEWKQQGMTATERAMKASGIRHEMRMTSRELMGHDGEKLGLLIRDAQEYGDGEGPSFEQVVAKIKTKTPTLEGDALMEAVVLSSTKTNKKFTERAQEDKPPPKVDLPPGVIIQGDVVKLPAKGGEGAQTSVRIKQGADDGPTRVVVNEDGTIEIHVSKTGESAVLLQEVAEQIRNLVNPQPQD